MTFYNIAKIILLLLVLVSLANSSMAFRKLSGRTQPQNNLLTYHNGTVLQGDVPISILWYGQFTSAQKSIISDFLFSLTSNPSGSNPSVSQWWKTIDQLYLSKTGNRNAPKRNQLMVQNQITHQKYSLGKYLTMSQIALLASKCQTRKGGITLVFTSHDVAVEGFCMSRCALHGSNQNSKTLFIWVGDSATQCPGECAWPFRQPLYGPQLPPLIAPNGDIGIDGMIINLASMIAGTITDPLGDGFYQGLKEAPLEVATACTGVYGKGAYPGYPGHLLVDPNTGASYNANGARGRKYLVPALFVPSTSTCLTLV